MTFVYNSVLYTITENTTLLELLEIEALKNASVSEIIDIIKTCWGRYNINKVFKVLTSRIDNYDSSFIINSFIYKGKSYWIDKNTRMGLMNLANCSTDNIDLVLGELIINLTPEQLKSILSKLEQYAGKCFVTTAKHKMAIKLLKTIDEMINYDYTEGYPEKIIID